MSLAAATREAIRNQPALYDALRAGIVNYTAAADSLDLDGDREAIATALRRFATELDETASTGADGRSIAVRLHSDLESLDTDALVAVDGAAISRPTAGSHGDAEMAIDAPTAVHVTGEVDARLLASTLDRIRIAEVSVGAAGVTDGSMVIVVARRDGPTVVQLVEATAESV